MKVYLGDLAHYTIKLTNNHTPLNIGFIAAFMKKHLGGAVEIKLFKSPDDLIRAIDDDAPDILALSNYVWCQSVSELALQYYKEVKSDGITVWGGPNFPMNELHKAKRYLTDRPYVDFYIPYEGETPMLNIAKAVMQYGSDASVLKNQYGACFEGAFFVDAQGELIGEKIGIQIPDLEEIPSPYLEGWMDGFLDEGLHAMFETQRGCPYTCTFCHTGLDYYKRGRSFSLERTKKEIEYIAEHVKDPRQTHLYITDSNFGMWPQDLEFAEWLNDFYAKTGFPLSFGTSTGKGRVNLVLKTVMAHPKLMLTNSVQSLDKDVLKSIKRRNLPLDQLKYSQTELDDQGKLSQPEIILGLPNETRESHLNTFRQLIHEIGANIIYQYTLMLLPGTEIYTDQLREEQEYMVKYRLLPTSFGEYAGKRCFEVEEVSVATKSLSYGDYLEMREMFFFVHNVYSNFIYRAMIRYLLYLEEDIIDFFLYLMKQRKTCGEGFPNRCLNDYIRDTEEELFDSKEELVDYYSRDENYKDLVSGRKGINLTHTYRTIILLNTREWVDFIVTAFRDYVSQRHQDQIVLDMTEAIIKHIQAQAECQHYYFKDRKSIPTEKNPIKVDLDFPIDDIFKQSITKESNPAFIKEQGAYDYFMKPDAVDYILARSEDQRTVDLALTVLRMDQSYLFPACRKAGQKEALSAEVAQ